MNDEWQTPNDIYNRLDSEFNFKFDAACTTKNKKCDVGNFIDIGVDALEAPWYMSQGSIWLNPPYSRGKIAPFMQKAYMESLKTDHAVVCLVRCDPTARWFKDWVNDKAIYVRMLEHRVCFVGAEASYPFPCCIVIYKRDQHLIDEVIETNYHLWSWK